MSPPVSNGIVQIISPFIFFVKWIVLEDSSPCPVPLDHSPFSLPVSGCYLGTETWPPGSRRDFFPERDLSLLVPTDPWCITHASSSLSVCFCPSCICCWWLCGWYSLWSVFQSRKMQGGCRSWESSLSYPNWWLSSHLMFTGADDLMWSSSIISLSTPPCAIVFTLLYLGTVDLQAIHLSKFQVESEIRALFLLFPWPQTIWGTFIALYPRFHGGRFGGRIEDFP